MRIVSLSEACNNLATVLEKAQKEPVTIQNQGRNAAVLLSFEEYQHLINAHGHTFQAICDDIGMKAEKRGLTEEKLAQILSETGG